MELTNLILIFIILDLLFLIFIESLVQLYNFHSVALWVRFLWHQSLCCDLWCNEYYLAPMSHMCHGTTIVRPWILLYMTLDSNPLSNIHEVPPQLSLKYSRWHAYHLVSHEQYHQLSFTSLLIILFNKTNFFYYSKFI